MSDIGKSVLARLKNLSKETGRSNQLCLQLFCQEEFFRRLKASRFRDNFVLKGGMFLYVLSGYSGRVTMDIDFMSRDIPNTPEKMKQVVEEIISQSNDNDFITFEIKSIGEIAVEKKYAGVNVSLVAKINNTRTPFSIDFGFGDIIIPGEVERELPVQLDGFEKITLSTYTVESTIAEKLDAILDRMEASSRMKDYYDIFYIASTMNVSGHILRKAIVTTFSNRGHELSLEKYGKVLEFSNNPIFLSRWKAFTKKIDEEISFEDVLGKIKRFISPVLMNDEFDDLWDYKQSSWR